MLASAKPSSIEGLRRRQFAAAGTQSRLPIVELGFRL
jgi:hypothetical protein